MSNLTSDQDSAAWVGTVSAELLSEIPAAGEPVLTEFMAGATLPLSVMEQYRYFFAAKYLQGEGIEIGALHSPLKVPPAAKVKYVDRMSVPDLKRQYRELSTVNLVEVDIVDNGELLETVADQTQDFVIASHLIEHCQDPILAIKNMLRVLKKGGILYLVVPDKRFSFDIDRPVTSIEHLILDHEAGPEWSKIHHFEEWVKLVEKVQDEVKVQQMVQDLIRVDYSIHFHVWTATDFIDFLLTLKKWLNFRFELETVFENGPEFIAILRI